MKTLNHAFLYLIGFFLCLFSIQIPVYAKTVNINHSSDITLDDTLWLSRVIPSGGEKNVFLGIGFDDNTINSHYSLYSIVGKSVIRTMDLPITIEESPNPYLHTEAIKFFRLIGNKLFIGIKKINGELYIAVVDIQEPHTLRTSINLKSRPEASLLLGDKGNFYLADIGPDGAIALQTIKETKEANQERTQGYKDSASGGQISATLYHNGFFYLTLPDITQKSVHSTMYQFDVNGTLLKKISIDGMVFQILPASEKSVLLIRSFGLEVEDSDALLYSTDLLHIKSFKAPHFYELIRYPGSMVGLSDGSLLYLRPSLDNSVDSAGDSIEVLRYSSETPPSLVARIDGNKKQTKIINIMNERAGQKMTVMTLKMVQQQEKLERFLDVYKDIDVSGFKQ